MVIGSLSSIAATRAAPSGGAAAPSPVGTPAAESAPAPSSAAPPATSSAAPTTPGRVTGGYISPYLRYDQMAHVAVLFFRDTDTGETKDQIPAERIVEEYRRNSLRLNGGTDTAAARKAEEDGKDAQARADRSSTAGTGQEVRSASGLSAGFSDSGSAAGLPASRSAPAPTSGSSAAATQAGSSGAAGVVPAPSGPTRGAPGGLVSVTV
ncbi:hypothetical protein [Azospirillum rugosum]|uniref:Uncharacterized protein n=1 Tax=Azospirillum rugosum TaxID=416170 RepID=A0ABS4SUW4_9PROT|nr:hypothetical protein [Azospirillum rugosum]MBP2296357.1 hypothetical protein [Azospirillum rugosum]MDQ0529878.1 hypothetical protein [Azospirillum rugosum]